MTAAEISAALRVAVGTVYSLASRHQWRRHRDPERGLVYNVDDIIATMTPAT